MTDWPRGGYAAGDTPASELKPPPPAMVSKETVPEVCTCRTIAPSGWDTVQQVIDPRCPIHAEPTFTASELKERLETATAVALALGRKEALEECAAAIENNHGWPTPEQKKALDFAAQIARNLANRDLPSQPAGGGSEPLTAPTGHSDLPPTPEGFRLPQEPCMDPDCPVVLMHSHPECSCYKLPRASDGVLRHHPECPNRPADLPEGSDQ